jgi:biotin operon repressor
MAKEEHCNFCDALISDKDVIALNKKLLGRSVKKKLCLPCLADYLSCTEDDLREKIEEFKEQGCALFS